MFYRFKRHHTIAFIYKTFLMKLKKVMFLSYPIKVMSSLYVGYGLMEKK